MLKTDVQDCSVHILLSTEMAFHCFLPKKTIIKRVNFNPVSSLDRCRRPEVMYYTTPALPSLLPPSPVFGGLLALSCIWLSLPDQDGNIFFAFFCVSHNVQNSSSLCSKKTQKFQKHNSMLVALLGYLQAPKETTACVVS